MSPNFDRANRRAVRLADVTSTSALLPPVARPRLGVVVDYADDFRDAVADVVEYEALGADLVTVSEADRPNSTGGAGKDTWRDPRTSLFMIPKH